MITIKHKTLIKWHFLSACFTLPFLLLFIISGFLYTFDIKGTNEITTFDLILETDFTPNLAMVTSIARNVLAKRQIPVPLGEPSLKFKKNRFFFRWNDLASSFKLRTTRNPKIVKVKIIKRAFVSQLMKIHKAKAGIIFQVISGFVAFVFILVSLIGVYLSFASPKKRSPALLAISLGAMTLTALILSH